MKKRKVAKQIRVILDDKQLKNVKGGNNTETETEVLNNPLY